MVPRTVLEVPVARFGGTLSGSGVYPMRISRVPKPVLEVTASSLEDVTGSSWSPGLGIFRGPVACFGDTHCPKRVSIVLAAGLEVPAANFEGTHSASPGYS